MVGLTEVKAWLRITDAEHDAELTALLARALDFVQRELDWYFGPPRAATETLSGRGMPSLWLRQPPVGGTVTVRERLGVGDTWTVVAAADYESEGRGLYHGTTWTTGFRNYQASYSEGFTVTPGDIDQLLLDLVAMKWTDLGNNPGMRSETLDYYSYTRADLEDLPGWGAIKAHWSRGRI
jgi:hypothetical protein